MVLTETAVEKYISILSFPLNNPGFVPSMIPLFVGLFVLEIYFGRYRFERLGWNSAVSNSTLLITTSLTLIYRLNLLGSLSGPRSVVAYGILALGLFILLMNFYHAWPEKIAFNVSSAFFTYTSAYIAIATVYEGMAPVSSTFIASGAVLLTFYVFFRGVQHLEKTVIPEGLEGRVRGF